MPHGGGQHDQGPAGPGFLEALDGLAGAPAFGPADRDEAAGPLEAFRGALAEGPGQGQEGQDQVMEVPPSGPIGAVQAPAGLLPGGGG